MAKLRVSWSDSDVGSRDEAIVDFVTVTVEDGVATLRSVDNIDEAGQVGLSTDSLDDLRKLVADRLKAAEKTASDLRRLEVALGDATGFVNASPGMGDEDDEFEGE